eukprot:m.25239 g.25239  ORF g.25239 m.25239 type:complete len:135 (+) comp11575_c0_seq1:203-607(+)
MAANQFFMQFDYTHQRPYYVNVVSKQPFWELPQGAQVIQPNSPQFGAAPQVQARGASQYSPEVLAKVQKAQHAFLHYDRDGNGHVTMDEFFSVLQMLGLNVSWAEAQQMFRAIDSDNSGSIEREEFVAYYLANY